MDNLEASVEHKWKEVNSLRVGALEYNLVVVDNLGALEEVQAACRRLLVGSLVPFVVADTVLLHKNLLVGKDLHMDRREEVLVEVVLILKYYSVVCLV